MYPIFFSNKLGVVSGVIYSTSNLCILASSFIACSNTSMNEFPFSVDISLLSPQSYIRNYTYDCYSQNFMKKSPYSSTHPLQQPGSYCTCIKLVDLWYHFICAQVSKGIFDLQYCLTEENIANTFTKALPCPCLEKLQAILEILGSLNFLTWKFREDSTMVCWCSTVCNTTLEHIYHVVTADIMKPPKFNVGIPCHI